MKAGAGEARAAPITFKGRGAASARTDANSWIRHASNHLRERGSWTCFESKVR